VGIGQDNERRLQQKGTKSNDRNRVRWIRYVAGRRRFNERTPNY
jgi:hypothetical protein